MTPQLRLTLLAFLTALCAFAPVTTAQGTDGVGGIEHVGGAGIDDGDDVPKVGPTLEFDGTETGDWTDLGHGQPPVEEAPSEEEESARLAGHGPGTSGSLFEIWVEDAQPEAAALLVIGGTQVNCPYKGNTFVPSPDLMLTNLPVNELGGLHVILQMPDNMPPGIEIIMQFVLQDDDATQGVGMTNAVRLVTG